MKIKLRKKSPMAAFNRANDRDTEFMLVEWPFAKEEEDIVIRGWSDDAAVVASTNSSFILKKAETSNSLLLFEMQGQKENIGGDEDEIGVLQAVLADHLECCPNDSGDYFSRLHSLLMNNIWDGSLLNNIMSYSRSKPSSIRESGDVNVEKGLDDKNFASLHDATENTLKLTMPVLLDSVPASESEIMEALNTLGAIWYGGCYYLLDLGYCFSFLKYVVATINYNQLNPFEDHINWDKDFRPWMSQDSDLETFLSQYPEQIMQSIVRQYSKKGFGSCDSEDSFCLDGPAITKLAARTLLMEKSVWNRDAFMAQWMESVRTVFELDHLVHEDLLKGIALTINSRERDSYFVTCLDADQLPWSFRERLVRLFQEKSIWSFDEIFPYLQKLYPDPKLLKARLLKCCNVVDSTKYSLKQTFT